MKNKIAPIMLAIVTTAASFSSVNVAQSHDIVVRHHHKVIKKHHHHPKNNAVVWGIVGLATGAIIANSLNNSTPSRPAPAQPQTIYPGANHYPAAPQAASSYSVRRTYEPWTPEWRRYCNNRYRSFNPSTGTYRGYDGRDHFCVYK